MATQILRPNGAGAVTGLTKGWMGTYNWQNVDEVTADSDSSYNYTESDTYVTDLYTLPAPAAGTINSITVYATLRLSAGSGDFKIAIRSDNTTTYGAEEHPPADNIYRGYSEVWAENPADSQPWEWADIDGLQIGASLKGVASTAVLTQVYVNVNYTPDQAVEITVPLATADSVALVPTIASLQEAILFVPLATIDVSTLVVLFGGSLRILMITSTTSTPRGLVIESLTVER